MPTWISDLRQRRRQPEIMDQPDLDRARHVEALRGLERINLLSGSDRILWRPIRALARELGRVLRILDIATGAGDVPIRLWRRGRRMGLPLQVTGCDISSQALDYAREHAARHCADVDFVHVDALADPIPAGYDVITCSLFLHHLDEAEAISLLRRMAQATTSMVLVNDLRRGVSGYLLAWFGVRALSASDVVRVDGPRSVEAAWTVREMQHLANVAGLRGSKVVKCWPCRMLLSWRRA
jgi:2-polyprenyl-3-methyl-5-hydroxy-6-metoxy-1,4-benzoquinol methylase